MCLLLLPRFFAIAAAFSDSDSGNDKLFCVCVGVFQTLFLMALYLLSIPNMHTHHIKLHCLLFSQSHQYTTSNTEKLACTLPCHGSVWNISSVGFPKWAWVMMVVLLLCSQSDSWVVDLHTLAFAFVALCLQLAASPCGL